MLSIKFIVLVLMLHWGDVAGNAWNESLSTVLQNGLREDLDIGTLIGNLYYQIDPGYGSVIYSTNSPTFNVDPSSGQVTLAQPLSFENQPTFGVIFFAKSLTGLQEPVTVQVTVLPINHPPMFDLAVYQISVKENAAISMTIYKGIYVTDRDQGPNGTVSISCSSDSQTDEAISACQTFTISSQAVPGTPHRYFGSVVLSKSLNYATKKNYNITVVAQDGGNPPLNTTSYLIVSVESSTDTRPIFINSPVIINMKEADPSSKVLAILQARDGSTDNPKDLTFQISSDPLHWFVLDPPTQDNTKTYSVPIRTYGNVSLPAINMNTEYSFTIIATESVNNQLTSVSSETTIQVNIQDTNTNPPTFDKPNYYVNVTEGLGIMATLPGLNMVITDRDLGNNAYFTLSCLSTPRPTPDIFLVIPTFGQGTVSATLVANKPEFLSYDDPSKRFYTVVVAAIEPRTIDHFIGSATVTINVLSSLNHPPYFPATEYPIAINDGYMVGAMITNLIRASDIDLGALGQLTYSLSPANPAFQIDPNTAVIRLAQVLNATVTPVIFLTVIATDGGGLSANASVRIEVIDSRHAGPKFVNSFGTDPVDSYSTNVTELTNNLIPSITVRAMSVPFSHDLLVVYIIVNGNDNGLFVLDFSSGVLTMNHGVDYNDTPNRQGYFELTVQALYNNYPEKPVTNTSVYVHILDTNNHAPTFSPSYYSTTVNEITPPATSLLTVSTSDLDFGLNTNTKVHYIVTDGSRDNFIIDYTTGIVSVASHPNLDIKQFGNQYNITILATDEGSPPLSGSAMVYIHVNDSVYQNPTFYLNPAAYIFSVLDNATANTYVGTTPATSPNARAVIVYSIIPNTMQATSKNGAPVQPGPNDFMKWFALNNRTGDINVVASNRISYDLVAQIDFKILANVTNPDVKSILSNTANVTIRIIPPAQNLDIVTFNPILPPDNTIRLTIVDRLPVPSPITQFAAYYYQDNKNINNFVFGPNQTDYFALNQTTGILTVNKSILYEQLPPDKTLSFIVVAKAPPPSTAASSATVIITVQRSVNAPAFELPNYDFYVNSNRPLNYFIGRVVASYLSNSVLTYDLTGQGSDYFNIDPNNGSITLMKRLDQQPVQLYVLRATATSDSMNSTATPQTGTVQVSIHVIPIHVNPPVFSNAPYSVNTQITLLPGTPIGQVFAKDPDIFTPTFVTYNIAGGNEKGLFNISDTTGIITIAKNLSVALSGIYQLNVSATDGANPPLVSYTTFTITVDNSSTGMPTFYFPSSEFIFYAYEKRLNTTVMTKEGYPVVITGMSHRAAYPIITYSLSSSPESQFAATMFNINPRNGSMTVNGMLDKSRGTSYPIFVTIADNGNPAFYNSVRINIMVISDAPPTFLCPGATPNISADVQGNLDPFNPPYKVYTLKACSNNLPNTLLYYNITGGNGPYIDNITSPFRIDENGQVFTNVKLYWYYSPTLTINVTVASNASDVPAAMKRPNSTVSITFNVIGGNNNGPLFYSSIPQCSGIGKSPVTGIMDVTEFGTQVIQLYAGDCDPPQFRNNTYSIDNIYSNNQGTLTQVKDAFTIEPDTGIVRTHFTDYRIYYQGVFQVTVRASDMTGQQNPDTTNLLVYIVREGQKLKFVYSKKPTDLRPQRNDFINGFNQLLTTPTTPTSSGPYKQKIYADLMVTNIDPTGYPVLDQTAMCYFVVDNSNSQAPYGSIVSVDTFRREIPSLDANTEKDLFDKYSVVNPYDNCYQKVTTMWWPRVNVDDQLRSSWYGYWFLWFILIAFAIFIFFVALILVICVCFYWIRNHRSMAANRPYVVLDEPPMSQAGASDWGGR